MAKNTSTRPPQDLEMERIASDAVERERSREHGGDDRDDAAGRVTEGVVPDGSLDRSQLIALLNEDLRTEYQSIVQYVQHAATLKGAAYLSTIAELKTHVSQELSHALVLAEQVDFLGGTPSVSVPDVSHETETEAALRLDLDLEARQLDRYRERVQQAGEMGLPDVAEALRPLLEQTQEHVRDLQTALGD